MAEIRRRLVCPKAPAGQKGARSAQAQGGAFKSMEASATGGSAAVTAAASSPAESESKTSEEVQPKEAKLEDGQEKEDGNKASQKVAKREKEVETSGVLLLL